MLESAGEIAVAEERVGKDGKRYIKPTGAEYSAPERKPEPPSEAELDEIRMISNVQHDGMTGPEKGDAIIRFRTRYRDKYPTLAAVADALGVKTKTVQNWMYAARTLSQKVKGHLKVKVLNEVHILQLAKYDKEAQERLCEAAISSKLSKDEISRFLRLFDKHPKRPLQDLVNEVRGKKARLMGVTQKTIDLWEGGDDESISNSTNVFVPPGLRVSIPRVEQPRIYERVNKGETQARVAADYKVTGQRIGQIVKRVERQFTVKLSRLHLAQNHCVLVGSRRR